MRLVVRKVRLKKAELADMKLPPGANLYEAWLGDRLILRDHAYDAGYIGNQARRALAPDHPKEDT